MGLAGLEGISWLFSAVVFLAVCPGSCQLVCQDVGASGGAAAAHVYI